MLGASLASHAATPQQLASLLEGKEPLTLIDLRSTSLFQQAHIPGAISIPAALVPEKQLPPLGKVIVYDSGLGRDETRAAVNALNRKKGIQAEALQGGFAAWESHNGPTTRATGVLPEDLHFITYDELTKAQSQDVVLVDLRSPRLQVRQEASAGSTAPIPPPLTDLQKAFPQVAAITRNPFDLPQTRQSTADAPYPLLVLIDDGKGSQAQETARLLRANGNARVVILAGGEEIVARQGQPGLQRRAVQQSPAPAPTPTGPVP
jgi:rhodanese-related sulfurtransferase